ncbi:MAG: sarcosine oxidase subunit gamma [Pseudomonadota bacterium]|nr:sarcosine oxidase subunit gamma [Pseudomonadota bacterium]
MPDAVIATRLERVLPLAGQVIAAPGVRVGVLGPAARWIVRGALPVAVPREACRALVEGERATLWLGPDEWLVLAPVGARVEVAPSEDGCVVEVSHRQVGFSVEGACGLELLLAGCPLDLAVQPVGFCTRTLLGKAEAVVWREGEQRWRVEVWRSFAAYAWALLEDAAGMMPR